MLMTLIPMYKIAKLSVLFLVGFCLVSFLPTNDVPRGRYFDAFKKHDLEGFYEDVLNKATDLFAHPISTPGLEVQNEHTSDLVRMPGADMVIEKPSGKAFEDVRSLGPGNSTLGFSSITALTSKSSTWRFEGLVQAANLTHLSIQALTEPEQTATDVENFNASHKAYISRGAIQAWMSHVRALENFLASNDSTTLILEDDVDWDVNIKAQMEGLSKVLQAHYAANSEKYPKDSQATAEFPYGYESWDVMWLGHCGGAYNFSLEQPGDSTLPYHDSSLLDLDMLITPESRLPIDPFFRYIYLPSAKPTPICSFAYAVNRQSAEKILAEVKREGLYEDAFDVRLYVLCRWSELKCLSAFPELFHHQQRSGKGGGSLIKAVDEEAQKPNEAQGGDNEHVAAVETESKALANDGQPPLEDSGTNEPPRWTENIKYSARCNSEPDSGAEPQVLKIKKSMRIRRRSAKTTGVPRAEQKWKMCLPWHRVKKPEQNGSAKS